jgi:hypothetical protein
MGLNRYQKEVTLSLRRALMGAIAKLLRLMAGFGEVS